MKLLLSFVALSLLGSASVVKFFEAPSELLLGEPIYTLAVSERVDAYQKPLLMSDDTAAIPGVAVGNFGQASAASTDNSSFRKPAVREAGREVVREAVRVPQEMPESNAKNDPAEKAEIKDMDAAAPKVETVAAEPDLTELAAKTAQPQNISQGDDTQEVAALTPAPTEIPSGIEATPENNDVAEPFAGTQSPIANIELPVRAPVYITSREGASTAPGNIGTGVSSTLNDPLINPDDQEAMRARRQAQRRAAVARRRAQQASVKPKPKPKLKTKPKASWQSDVLGGDD